MIRADRIPTRPSAPASVRARTDRPTRLPHVSCLLFGLLVFAAACAAPAPDVAALAADTTGAVDSTSGPARPRREARPQSTPSFAHDVHGDVDCTRCHAQPAGHLGHGAQECTDCHTQVVARVAGEGECVRCHHESQRFDACTRCHETTSLPRRRVAAPVRVAAGPASARELPFDHARHAAESCVSCHARDAALAPRACMACHDRHHRAEADCTACHDATSVSAHTVSTHAGCGGAGCHADVAWIPLRESRSVCLACHPAEREHEAARPCARCHLGPAPTEAAR